MVTREQAIDVLNKIKHNMPTKFFNKIDEASACMSFILVFLSENDNEIYASTIAKKMNISRARVAVLISKLITKGMITKSSSGIDGRIDVLKITQNGLNEVELIKEQAFSSVIMVIEKIGIEEIYRFIDTSAKIKNIIGKFE